MGSPTKRPRRTSTTRWSNRVTHESNALDLEPGVFKLPRPEAIAESLLRSARASQRRKGTVLSSAMSMLVFYINRAGKSLGSERRQVLEAAKAELRRRSPANRDEETLRKVPELDEEIDDDSGE